MIGSLADLLNSPKYKLLGEERREKLRLCFEMVNPFKPVNILVIPDRE
jgi:hypothetical protein